MMSRGRWPRVCGRRGLVIALLAAVLALGFLVAPPRAAGQTEAPGAYAPTFELTGAVERPSTITADMLRAYPPARVEATFITGSGVQSGTYVGPLLWDLLQQAGVVTPSGQRSELLRMFVAVTGSDDYQVVLALAELLPDFGGQPVLVAYERDGQPFDAAHGMAQLIVPGDKRAGRSVFQVTRIEVHAAPR